MLSIARCVHAVFGGVLCGDHQRGQLDDGAGRVSGTHAGRRHRRPALRAARTAGRRRRPCSGFARLGSRAGPPRGGGDSRPRGQLAACAQPQCAAPQSVFCCRQQTTEAYLQPSIGRCGTFAYAVSACFTSVQSLDAVHGCTCTDMLLTYCAQVLGRMQARPPRPHGGRQHSRCLTAWHHSAQPGTDQPPVAQQLRR